MNFVEGAPPETLYCSECGRACAPEEVVKFGERRVCAVCKPAFAQRLREGAVSSGAAGYGGFWIRALAAMIDGMIMAAIVIPIQLAMVFSMVGTSHPEQALVASLGANVVGLLAGVSYEAFFLVRFAATPGKMICRLKVLTAEGQVLGWGRAVGRYFAKYISGLTLGIGFLLACVDEQKRTLHDHICSTRVVKRASAG